jgi:hypothetical protein
MKEFLEMVEDGKADMETFERRYPVELKYRHGGHERILIVDDNEVTANCKVYSISINKYPNPEIASLPMKSINDLIPSVGFNVEYEIVNKNAEKCMNSATDQKSKVYRIKTKKIETSNPSVWKYLYPEFYIEPNTINIMPKINDNNEIQLSDLNGLPLESDTNFKNHIVTKKLKAGKIIDTNLEEFEAQREDEINILKLSKKDLNQEGEESVFNENIFLSQLNSQPNNLKNPKKIFSKLLAKENKSYLFRILKIFGIIWFLILVGFSFAIYGLFNKSSQAFTNNMDGLINVMEIFQKSLFLVDYMYDLEFYERKMKLRNATIEERSQYINDMKTSINDTTILLSEKLSNLYFTYDSSILRSAFEQTYELKYLNNAQMLHIATFNGTMDMSFLMGDPFDFTLVTDEEVKTREYNSTEIEIKRLLLKKLEKSQKISKNLLGNIDEVPEREKFSSKSKFFLSGQVMQSPLNYSKSILETNIEDFYFGDSNSNKEDTTPSFTFDEQTILSSLKSDEEFMTVK